ncbi:signal transduction histidine kinase [Comamonas sp. BIGb0124]|nr:signal transduction histidine kinase [Comamonas sp. BIGb0124]
MAHQYGLLLLLALLASHLLAILLIQRTGELIHPLSRQQALSTLTSAYRLAALESSRPDALLAALGPPSAKSAGVAPGLEPAQPARLWLSAQADVDGFEMRQEEQRLAADVRKALELGASVPVWIQIERLSGQHARSGVLSTAGWEPLQLRASIAQPGGRWLNARQSLHGGYDWTRILAFSLPVSIVPVLVVAWLLALRLIRPLKALIAATARVNHGRPLPPLPVHGPHEARELITQFNAMQDRIARHVDGRTRLLAAISHDLRTPVTALRLQAELIDDDTLRQDMLESLAELQAMVEETLDFARAEGQAEAWRTLDMARTVADIVERYRHLGQAVRWVGAPPVQPIPWPCKPIALKRAIANLVDNALRHAGDVQVDIGIDRQPGGGTLLIVVQDRGPGIASDQLEQVFEPFHRLDASRGRQDAGLGLGLSIARACVVSQGGQLVLANRDGGGLRASITLPWVEA